MGSGGGKMRTLHKWNDFVRFEITMKLLTPEYNTVTIETALTGWVVREKGRPTELFIRWESLVNHLAKRLTSKGDKGEE